MPHGRGRRHFVADRDIARSPRAREARVLFDESVPEEGLRRIPVAHRAVVCERRWRERSRIEERRLDRVPEDGRFAFLRDGAARQKQERNNQAPAKQSNASEKQAPASSKPVSSGSGFDDFEDDIPF